MTVLRRNAACLAVRIALINILIFTAALPALADRIAIPEGLFYYVPASSVFGPEAAWVNPAALGRYRTLTYQFMADLSDNDAAQSWGLAFDQDGFGFAYRYIHNPAGDNYRELVWSAGFDLGSMLEFGGSYRYFDDAPGILLNRHFWNLGFAGDVGPLRWGAVFANLNRGYVNGVRTETEMRYSFAYRPLGKRFTLAADALLSTKTRFSRAEFVYNAELSVAPGIWINGFIDSHQNFQLGFRMNLVHYFVGSQNTMKSSGSHRRTTLFFGATASRQTSIMPGRPRRLQVNIKGNVPENPPKPFIGRSRMAFTELILAIYRASNDPSIGEMLLTLNDVSLGFGRTQELRRAIDHFQSKGKRVICFLAGANNLGYYLASTCDRIYVPPVSQLELVGLRAELTFYAATLDKIGVKADLIRIGDYKSAPEIFTNTESSPEYREQVNRLLDDLDKQFIAGIAEGRNMSTEHVRELIDQGPWLSTDAVDVGLVDGRIYRDKLLKDELPPMPSISMAAYLADTVLNDNWPRRPVVAVVVAEGDIAADNTGWPLTQSGDLTPGRMKKALSQMKHTRDVEATVLRVDSPGGFALAGEDIHHEIEKDCGNLPLVVSMANVAASGGFYISTPASRLFANGGTVTGSIGIFGGKVDLSGLYAKLDIGKELYTRGTYAAMMTSMRPFTKDEREKYYASLLAFYNHFVDLVAENRSLPADSVDHLSRGRVWTGEEAVDNGLVDRTGGLYDAITYVSQQRGLHNYRVRLFPEDRPFFQFPGHSLLDAVKAAVSGSGKSPVTQVLAPVLNPGDGQMFTRLPFDLDIQ